jgi:hypothetical protein
MTRRLASLLAVAAVSLASCVGASIAAPPSFKLFCRGPLFNAFQDTPSQGRIDVFANFRAGDGGRPAVGSCTWADRGFRPGEPTRFHFNGNRHDADMLLTRSTKDNFQWYVYAFNHGSYLEITKLN